MDISHSEIQQFVMVPAAMMLMAFFFIAVLVVQGYSMKCSVNLCDAGPIGFLYGLLTTFVMGIGGAITCVAISLGAGTTNQWVLMLYSMTAGIVALMLMFRCNPFKAFLAYLCHTVFSMIGMAGVVMVAVMVLLMMSSANMIQYPKNSPAMFSPAASSFGTSVPAAPSVPSVHSGGNGL